MQSQYPDYTLLQWVVSLLLLWCLFWQAYSLWKESDHQKSFFQTTLVDLDKQLHGGLKCGTITEVKISLPSHIHALFLKKLYCCTGEMANFICTQLHCQMLWKLLLFKGLLTKVLFVVWIYYDMVSSSKSSLNTFKYTVW